ncbi:glycoside hydrolase family 3 C-terminal domain-containing protein [Pseudoduganella sp. LjRoot289]|uniref:glycoside hydrolase family 3 C-terminal domain-containing protein n=1 Tax=Pseudoduganella sp. LjRoot289 TaxID=3342314 RepID=UPI003ED0D9C6
MAFPALLGHACAHAGEDARTGADTRARALVAQLTFEEKLEQLLNVAPAIPRLCIPAYNWWTESLHGALGPVPTTNFPEPVGLAASFNRSLTHQVAAAVSVEVRALHTLGRQTGKLGKIGTGLNTWSPNINIFRDPRWGRGQETYGEDPFLTAAIGVAFIQGMQGPNPELPHVVATPKHFAVHSGPESTRHHANVFVSPHDLEDTYLPAFRAAIVDAKAGSVMCAYNRVNGQPACASDLLLKRTLRDAWGFKGYVVSDCDAVTDISEQSKYAPDAASAGALALKAGVDNECNGQTLTDAKDLGARYRDAHKRHLVSTADIDTALVRLFSARYRNGDLGGLARPGTKPTPVSAINTPEHQHLALKSAIESLVLLKNDGVLPLKPGVKLAVIGPLADATRVLRGNYSSAQSAPPVSVLDGLRRTMPGAQITLVPAGASITDGDPVPASAFRAPDGQPGLHAAYFNARPALADGQQDGYQAAPAASRVESGLVANAGDFKNVDERNRIVWTGYLVPPESGTYRIGMSGVRGEVTVDGKPAVQAAVPSQWAEPLKLAEVTLQQGQRYPVRFETETGVSGIPGLFWKRISLQPEADLASGVRDADVVVAVVGLTADLEGEEMAVNAEGFAGGDKTSLDIPADQRRLLEQAKALGKPLVVVVMSGSALDLSWAKAHASAIVEAWYPGQAGGLGIAQVLTGQANPGGRLPLTFYRSVNDLPPFDNYAMKGRTYRYFEGTPVYPFGYGLSYTTFAYAPLRVAPAAGGAEHGVTVVTDITNTGTRDGDEVAQLYLVPPAVDGAPRLALRGFERLTLKAGERRQIKFVLSPRDLSFVSQDGVRQLMPGQYKVVVGSGQPGTGVAGQSGTITLARPVVLPK